jgi:hypothetical protein
MNDNVASNDTVTVNNNPFLHPTQEQREQEQTREEEEKVTSAMKLTTSSSPTSPGGPAPTPSQAPQTVVEKERGNDDNTRDVSDISVIRFRRQSSVHDIGPMELSSSKTTVLELKEKLKQFVVAEEEERRKEKKNESNTQTTSNKISSITNNLTIDDIKVLYLGKVLDGCDDATLFQLGIPSAGVTTIMHVHVVPPNMRRKTSTQKLATLGTKLMMGSGDVDHAQPSCCSIQ